nr:MAG TPA: hypothetical protein [Caudoviricetes sp.]
MPRYILYQFLYGIGYPHFSPTIQKFYSPKLFII